jgi:GNAT superfamily N-acetyltransferase
MLVDDLARTIAFERWLTQRTSTRVEHWTLGSAFFNDDFPRRWDSNFLWVERPLAGAAVVRLAGEADRLLDGSDHRQIRLDDDDDGTSIAMGLGKLGYMGDHLVVMARRREPDRAAGAVVEEVAFDDIRPLHVAVNLTGHGGAIAADAETLADFHRVIADVVDTRFYVARDRREVVAGCELYLHDGVAQVEDVNTLEPYRGRGLARAVVLRAVEEARGSGAELVFLHADANDWPKHLYAKLGFDPIGHVWSFVRTQG